METNKKKGDGNLPMAKLRVLLCEDGSKGPRNVLLKTAQKLVGKPGVVIWVDVEEQDNETMKKLEKAFKLHHLALEDALNERQRSKIEEYSNFAFIVAKVFQCEDSQQTQLNLFLGSNFIISVHGKEIPGIESTHKEVHANPIAMARGADYVAYMILDSVVDDIFPHLDELEDKTEEVEDAMLSSQPEEINKMLIRLSELKRKNLCIRKIAWPMRDVLTVLARRDYKFVKPEQAPYFRDVYDHMLRIVDITEMNRELLAATMEAYLAVVSNNLNLVMKKMTALAAMFAIPMLIASIYGMNFHNMPELDFPYGYYIALGEMLVCSLLIFVYFRLNKWI